MSRSALSSGAALNAAMSVSIEAFVPFYSSLCSQAGPYALPVTTDEDVASHTFQERKK